MAIKKSFVHFFIDVNETSITNKDTKDTVLEGHQKTDIRQYNVEIILFALFVPWNL